jgi:amidase
MSRKQQKKSARKPKGVSRRSFLQLGAVATAGATLLPGASVRAIAGQEHQPEGGEGENPFSEIEEATIADLQEAMSSGRLTARRLVEMYLRRIEAIDRHGPRLQSIIETNRHALEIAEALDRERAEGHVLGPLHGIPIVLKDNYDTQPSDEMLTTAGSRALAGVFAPRDATVVAKLRAAGAIMLGKANLSEWANFRSARSVSGWSGRGRQCYNPYVTDRSPCGSSSGSAIAVSANLAAGSLGTETNGSVLCPSSICGCAGIKTTIGLTSRAGVVPISSRQDTSGPICRTVADAATMLGAMTGVDPRDPATAQSEGHFFTDYTQFLDRDGLKGARIGIVRNYFATYDPGGRGQIAGYEHADAVVEPTIQIMHDLGAEIVDPANFANFSAFGSAPATQVLFDEFKVDINDYLATRPDLDVHTLEDLIAFNNADAANEMPYFEQELFILTQTTGRPLDSDAYLNDAATLRRIGGREGIDAVLAQYNLDALFTITRGPGCTVDLLNGDRFFVGSSTPGAIAGVGDSHFRGYPTVTVTADLIFGALPIGVSFFGTAWSEPTLIRLAYAFEQALKERGLGRKRPRFLRTLRLP